MPIARSARLVETLAGLLEGVAIDDIISTDELVGLRDWYAHHRSDLAPHLDASSRSQLEGLLAREGLSAAAHRELMDYCRDFGAKHTPTHPTTREAFARLQGMALGLLADGALEENELRALQGWLDDYREFREHFVFGAFFDALDEVIERGRLDPAKVARVRELCETFGAPPPPRVLPEGFVPAPGPYERTVPRPAWAEPPLVPEADYYCLDLETANDEPDSVCALGLAAVKDGVVLAVGATYVDPKTTFDRRHQRIHGIGPEQCRGRGPFELHWRRIQTQLAGKWLLAHNATFTARCLKALRPRVEPPVQAPRLLCTLKLARAVWPRAASYSLDRLAAQHQLTKPAHDPQAGARACAELAIELCQVRSLDTPSQVAAELGVAPTPLERPA